MGSRKHSYTQREWTDVAFLLNAFEEVNAIGVSLSVCLQTTDGLPDLCVSAMAFTQEGADVVPVPLALVDVSARSTELTTMNALLTNVLYRLDAELARQMYEKEHGA